MFPPSRDAPDSSPTSSTSPRTRSPSAPIAVSARWIRAFCFVARAFGPRRSHSISFRRKFWRFDSTRSAWA